MLSIFCNFYLVVIKIIIKFVRKISIKLSITRIKSGKSCVIFLFLTLFKI